ncbi:unnamed protein product, partial [marine sediment metagenome]
MNILFDFPEFFTINIGQYVESFIKWLIHNYDFFFDAIKEGVLWFLLHARSVFMWFPWAGVIIIVFILGWKLINWKSVVLVAVVIACLIGVPLGILIAYNSRFGAMVKPILDAMQ